MDYTTEMIDTMAGQVVTMLKSTLSQAGETADIGAVETHLRELLQQVGAAALGQYLSMLGEKSASPLPCACGGEQTY